MPPGEPGSKALTYTDYLKIDQLLELQQPRSAGPEHDEMLFIIIHQVYELWFKEVLHEIAGVQRSLEGGDVAAVLGTLKRVLTILKTLVGQVDVLETMTPMSFNSFRSRLDSASGFQSAQFRELEFRLGRKDSQKLADHPEGTRGRRALDELYGQPTLWDSFMRFLAARGYRVPESVLARDFRAPIEPSEEVQATLLEVYRGDHILAMVCERLVDLDEGLQEWRYRHVKMVERTIGDKPGTGGSAGAAYLRTTLHQPLFPDLWRIRAAL